MPSNDSKILRAKALRQTAISQLVLIIEAANAAKAEAANLTPFKVRYRSLSKVEKDFEKHHNNLLALLASNADELKVEEKINVDFTKRCHEIKTIYYELFELPLEENGVLDTSIHPVSPSTSTQRTNIREHAILPKIQLITFKGDVTAFPTFNQTFSTLIHNNRTLSNIEKFNYLLSCLEGTAKDLISDIQVTHDNYLIAYNMIIDRYNNKRLLAFSHWKLIEECPRSVSENASSLRQLLDTFSKNLSALQNLKFDPTKWDFILAYMLLDRLDNSTRKAFEQQHASNDVPKYETIRSFLQKQCTALESIPQKAKFHPNNIKPNVSIYPRNQQNQHLTLKNKSAFLVKNKQNNKCFLCKETHIIYRCPTFISKTVQQRFEIIKNQRACVNCLATAHTASQCTSEKRCRNCNQTHHTLLCFKQNSNTNVNSHINIRGDTEPGPSGLNLENNTKVVNNDSTTLVKTSTVGVLLNDHEVLLSTVLLRIKDAFNNWHTIKAILDSGAQSSFITKSFANKLSLPKFNIAMSLQGLDSMHTTAKLGIQCTVSSINNLNTTDLNAIIINKICDDNPAVPFSKDNFPFISNLVLADPTFSEKSKIDMLLGNDVFPYILCDGRFYNGPDQPVCVNTIFGWILMGKTTFKPNNKAVKSFFTTTFINSEILNTTLQNFWQVEEVPEVKTRSPEDDYCERYFLQTTTRSESGRYVVSLPFKITAPDFGDTYTIALRRFLSLENKFLQNSNFYKSYCDVIQEYLDSGHIQMVSKPLMSNIQDYFYIPHHAVFKKDSISTPMRVVFDANVRAPNKLSLNDALYTGPKLQTDLVSILLNFRLHRYVFTCDIKQMFRMILVDKKDQIYQRILWRFSHKDPILHYQINVVTFGMVCSPYLAIRTLLKLADDYTDLPLASEILKTSTYIDDITGGGATRDQLILIKNQIIELLSRGGFEARKWASNCPDLLNELPDSIISKQSISLDLESSNILKILGLKWDPVSDTFCYQFSSVNNSDCTKRTMLSELARTFDPLGFLTPLTIFIKMLIQVLWSLGLDWDEKPPEEIVLKWNKFKNELQFLNSLNINREVNITETSSHELFGFCDASERAYCGIVYIRVLFPNNKFKLYFVCAKSKVSTLKTISLARLELSAAVLLTKLMRYILNVYSNRCEFKDIYAFTDSSVVLTWIKSSPHRWKTFVSNRVSYIQENLSPDVWRHVPSELNPADCGSRGMLPSELIDFSLWWEGPDFLYQPKEHWTFCKFKIDEPLDVSREQRKFTITTCITYDFLDQLFTKFNSLRKIKRIVAYVLRAVHKFKTGRENKVSNYSPYLNITELHNALLFITKHVQSTHFTAEISALNDNKPLPKYLQRLKPFLDNEGYMRVGGRLFFSDLPYHKKFPFLLPPSAKFTNLLIYDIHITHLHCGIQTTQYLLFQNFWVISAKRIIRKVIRQCHTCWKVNPMNFQPPMGDLPKFRVSEPQKAFTNVGLDMCGPFPTTVGKLRGAKVHKSYICLFICGSTKAVHLELLSDLSSECFLAALRRFIGRRGKILNLYSDCGTNFIGGEKYLHKIFSESAETEAITWHFNPPYAPHMGGIWEANIKSVKYHLVRVVGTQLLTYEELNTVIIQIEAVLNSRPLCPISADPSDLAVLTPGHFLTLQPLTVLPDPDTSEIPCNRHTRWQLLLRIHRDFWNRWHKEYLHTLQQRAKWHKPINTVLPGTMVVIKDDKLPPLKWSTGKIVEVISGHDEVPRVAVVKTKTGLIKRPLIKLCPLPLN